MSMEVLAQGHTGQGGAGPSFQSISRVIGGVSPFLLIGLGIMLILVQKLAKLAGIIVMVIGIVRLIFMYL